MSTAIARIPPGRPEDSRPTIAQLRGALDMRLLASGGWNDETRVLEPPRDHAVLGYRVCAVPGCDDAVHKGQLCAACGRRREKAGKPPVDEFLATPRPPLRATAGSELCLVCRNPGHERPSSGPKGLCDTHEGTRRWRQQDVSAFVDGDAMWAAATPLESFGRCMRLGCEHWAINRKGLCNRCAMDWRSHCKRSGAELDLVAWRARTPVARAGGGRFVDFAAVPERVRLELLLGIQDYLTHGRQLSCWTVQAVVGRVDRNGIASLLDLPDQQRLDDDYRLVLAAQRAARFSAVTVEAEMEKDVWDTRALGFTPLSGKSQRRFLQFDPIAQPWLREGAKQWAAEKVTKSLSQTGNRLQAIQRLSAALDQRDDRGMAPELLDRSAWRAVLLYFGELEREEAISRKTRRRTLSDIGRFLLEIREWGLTRDGPLRGLPGDFVLRQGDNSPKLNDQDTAADKALPQVVMDQLLDPAALELMKRMYGADLRDLLEFQAWVGRRTSEACNVRADCLVRDNDGSAYLRFDAWKTETVRVRIPIHEHVAELIEGRARIVAERFPMSALPELALFPRVQCNPLGLLAIPQVRFASAVRGWADALPALMGPDGGDFPRARVFPYAFRHTYAQVRADRGVPVDVLAKLLVHENLKSTQVYYTIPEERLRMANALVVPLTQDRNGEFVGGSIVVDALLTQKGVGQIPVPMGWCVDEANVKALGQSCDFRHQCLACTKFRTDPSHLDDLRAYLQRLLVDHERIAARLPELEAWARDRVLPSRGEIEALRGLIQRNEEILEGLPDVDRDNVMEAIREIAKQRLMTRAHVPRDVEATVRNIAPTLNPGAIEVVTVSGRS